MTIFKLLERERVRGGEEWERERETASVSGAVYPRRPTPSKQQSSSLGFTSSVLGLTPPLSGDRPRDFRHCCCFRHQPKVIPYVYRRGRCAPRPRGNHIRPQVLSGLWCLRNWNFPFLVPSLSIGFFT